MQPLNCLILEDDKIDALMLRSLLRDYPKIRIAFITDSYQEAKNYLSLNKIDILFLDVDLQNASGLNFRSEFFNIPICVFISAYKEHAIESFNLETLDFIEKPLNKSRFDKTYQRIIKYQSLLDNQKLYSSSFIEGDIKLKNGKDFIMIKIADIIYLESLKDYTILHLEAKKHYLLKGIGQLLENEFKDFIRIHKQYAIQKSYITSYNFKTICLAFKIKLPIGRTYKSFLEKLN